MSDEAIQKPYVDYDYYSKDYRGTEASINSILEVESITLWIGSRISRTAHFMRNSQTGLKIRTAKRSFRIFRKIAMRRR